ncbi:MAG: IS66 family transposase, partial [Trebonia sp.]
AKQCPGCGEVSAGLAPAGVTGRVQYGPVVHAKAALATCAHYLPVARAASLVARLTGVSVSAGFVAGVRGKAAARLGPFMDRVRDLLRSAAVLYADETPARTAGKLHYVHVACTEFLTAMHTGDRTKEAIDAGGILPDFTGTIVRDGYKGYEHLTDALHAWCGAHGLRDLVLAATLSAHGSASFDVRVLAGLGVDAVPGGDGQSLLPSWLVKRLASALMVSSSSASILACRLAAIWSRRAAACCSRSAAWCPAW